MGNFAITGKRRPQFIGNQKMVACIGAPSTVYQTGGEVLLPNRLGITRVDYVEVWPYGNTTTTYVVRWNLAQSNPLSRPRIAYFADSGVVGDPLVEETAGVDLSAFPVWIQMFGV